MQQNDFGNMKFLSFMLKY